MSPRSRALRLLLATVAIGGAALAAAAAPRDAPAARSAPAAVGGAPTAAPPAAPPAGAGGGPGRPLAAPLAVPLHARPAAVVVLGDGWAAGDGAGGHDPADPCRRSPRAAVAVAPLPQAPVRLNLACAGAGLAEVRGAQLGRLRAAAGTHEVRAVVISAGAAELRLADVTAACADARRDCATLWRQRLDTALAATKPQLAELVDEVRRILDPAGHRYRIVLQSYPAPLTDRGRTGACPGRTRDAAWLRDHAVRQTALMYRRLAVGTSVHVLDLAPALTGRELCTAGSWVDRATLLPNAAGQAALGGCLAEYLAREDPVAECARGGDGRLHPRPVYELPAP